MAFKSILDPDFTYRNALSTDVRKTFERIRREQRLSEQPAGSGDNENHGAEVVAKIGQRQRGRPHLRG
jgi:hypothetical protein